MYKCSSFDPFIDSGHAAHKSNEGLWAPLKSSVPPGLFGPLSVRVDEGGPAFMKLSHSGVPKTESGGKLFAALTSGQYGVGGDDKLDFPPLPGSPPSLLQTLRARESRETPQQRRLELSPPRQQAQVNQTRSVSEPRCYLSESGVEGAEAVIGWVDRLHALVTGEDTTENVVVSPHEFCAKSIGCMCGGVNDLFLWDSAAGNLNLVSATCLVFDSRSLNPASRA